MNTLAEAQPAPVAPAVPDLSLERAVPMFLEYLRGYRSCSPLSIRSYAADLRYFQEFLAARGPLPPPSRITRQTVVQFAVTLSHWSPVTVRRKLSCLSSFFSFLQDMGYVSGNPARRLPLPKQERRMPVALSEEQARKLVAAAERPWHRCLVVLLLATGMRRSELLQVTLEDVDAQNRQLLVHGKGSAPRPLTMGWAGPRR
jgi:integrase/recombinase XerC